jgi:hypoxanthine phosphoribosyltransferase
MRHRRQAVVLPAAPFEEASRKPLAVTPLLSAQQLREGVERLAREVAAHYQRRPLTIVGVLNGSIVLLADLIRHLDMPLRVGMLQTRSYRGEATRPGELKINLDLFPDVGGRDVLLIDDIYDTGHTLAAVSRQLRELGASSVRSAVLLRKAGRRQVELTPDHVAFEIPDAFVVGYGMDYNDLYRNLPYVAALETADMEGPPA